MVTVMVMAIKISQKVSTIKTKKRKKKSKKLPLPHVIPATSIRLEISKSGRKKPRRRRLEIRHWKADRLWQETALLW